MNLIKALGELSAKPDGNDTDSPPPFTAPQPRPLTQPEKTNDAPNVMASVIARHERISNRVRSEAAKK